jgi:hypothetical protein
MVWAMSSDLPSASSINIPIEAGVPWEMDGNYWKNHDTSFARQMAELVIGDLAPEAYLVTANSAIPVADSIRGFFEELGQTSPPIYPINANSEDSWSYYFPGEGHDTSRVYANEVKRLNCLLEGFDNVCVVDQYVFSGRTISFAAQMMRSAGVEGNIGGIRGLWYNGISYQDIDHHNLCAGDPYVSAHMKAIGRKACQRAYAA